MEKINQYLQTGIELVKEYTFTIIPALFVLIVGLWVIKLITKAFKKNLKKKDVDKSLQSFLGSLVSAVLKVLLVVTVISMLGVEATSFIAILGAAGLAIGMALSGTLQNFAGGVLLLIFRPFKIGDYIVAQDHEGVVEDIQIFVTTLKTLDNRIVFLPNGPLSNGSLVNVTREPMRRVDLTFGIGYGDDIDTARSIIQGVADSNTLVLKDPKTDILVSELADSSVNLETRLWCNTADYWNVYFQIREAVKKAFDKGGISIPFPQQDVYMHNVN